jgi:hypothetical protein
VAGLLAFAAAGADAGPAEEAPVRAFLVEQHAPEIAHSFTTLALELADAEPPPGAPAGWRAQVERAFSGDALFESTLKRARERWDPARAEAFARFRATPLGARVHAAESEVLRTDRAALDAFLARQPQEPAPEERVALVQRLDRAKGSSELYVRGLGEIRDGLRRAAGTAVEAEASEDRELLASLAAAGDASLRAQLRAVSASTALFAFRDLSTPELAEYVAWSESADAQWGFRELNDALLAALRDRAAALELAAR